MALRTSKFVLALGVEQLISPLVVPLGNRHSCDSIQIPIIGQVCIHIFLSSGNSVFLEHGNEHFGINNGSRIKELHV